MVRTQLVSREGTGRQMLSFAYRRELGPVPNAFDHSLGLTIQPLTGEANQTALTSTQPMNRTRTHNHRNHLTSDPMRSSTMGYHGGWWAER